MSIRLTTGSRIAETSSKGNQEKWLADGRWYKLDLFGYEGLAETVTSALLAQTNTGALGFRYVTYRMERLEVHDHTRNGCSSANFLRPGEAILPLAELLRKGVGPDWQTAVNRLPNLQSRLAWLVEQVERLTGLDRFGTYLTLLFEVDMLFGNEDRHLNNFGLLRNSETLEWLGFAPIYDSGSSLGYDKVASQIRSEREVGCKPFKNHHAEQIKLVSDFSWIDFGRLSDVKDLIIETLTADGAEEYMDAGRIEAITESVERRIRNLSELAMKQTAYPTASTEDDVEEDIAEDYTPKMTL